VRERRYAGPEESVEPGLLADGSQLEPAGATDAEGLTADEAVIADAQDAQLADSAGEDGGEGQPAPSGEGQPAPSDEGQPAPSDAKHPHGSGESPASETPPTATDVDPSSEAGEEETGALAADEPA
jgi:hypothetical protein